MSVMKRKREAMPPEYVKGPGKPGHLHPHWRKSFPDDEEDSDGRGKVVDVPDALRLYGVWRRVPGFWKILASDEGFIVTEGELRVRVETKKYKGYHRVCCNASPEQIHLLVARAFHGRPTADQVSIDHGDRNKSNNCAANLGWATAAQQRRNQGEAKANSHGEPCLVWQVMGSAGGHRKSVGYVAPVDGTELQFRSKYEAASVLGLHDGQLSDIFNGKKRTVANAEGKRFTGKWNPDHADLDDEEWKWASKKLRVSNHGRLQWVYANGREGTKHFPENGVEDDYLRVSVDGQVKGVHVLVGELFWIGPKPRNWAVWDHKDGDRHNNHISNLRPVTQEENMLNTARQRAFYLWPIGEPDNWMRCVSQSATARAYNFSRGNLGNVLHKRPDGHGYINKTVHGYCAAFCNEVE